MQPGTSVIPTLALYVFYRPANLHEGAKHLVNLSNLSTTPENSAVLPFAGREFFIEFHHPKSQTQKKTQYTTP